MGEQLKRKYNDLYTNNERHDCKICTMCVCVGTSVGRRVNKGDEGEGIWLMTSYTYMK
jgi:hypothetical protein